MSISSYFADLETRRNMSEYKAAIRQSLQGALMSQLIFGSQDNFDLPLIRHPLHAARVQVYKAEYANLPKTKSLSINFGDSLTDLAREYFKGSLDAICSISGSYANHMQEMAEDTRDFFMQFDIGYVFVGTLGGNPMLVYRNYDQVLKSSLVCLDRIRQLYPRQKIIVYGLPPVYNLHATQHAYRFTTDLVQWAQKDRNSTVIDLHGALGSGPLKLFPTARWSSDGVHLTPSGAMKLSKKFNQAKTTASLLMV